MNIHEILKSQEINSWLEEIAELNGIPVEDALVQSLATSLYLSRRLKSGDTLLRFNKEEGLKEVKFPKNEKASQN